MRGRSTLLASLLCFACGPRLRTVELPPAGEARSLLLAIEALDPSSVLSLTAVDLLAHGDVTHLPGLDDQGALRLTALLYPQPLADLLLAPGPVELTLDASSRPLPPETSSAVRVLEAGDDGAWTEAPAPESVRSLRLPAAPVSCPRLQLSLETLIHGSPKGNGRFVVPLAGGTLVGTSTAQAFYRGPGEARHRVLRLPPGVELRSAARHPLDPEPEALWVGDTRGVLYRAHLGGELRLEPLSQSPYPGGLAWLATSSAAGDVEAFALSEQGHFSRYLHGRWELLHQLLSPTGDVASEGAVLRLGPGRALAVSDQSPLAARFEDGALRLEAAEESESVELTTAVLHPTLGVILANGAGRIFARREDAWRAIGDWGFGVPFEILALAPSAGGLLVGGRNALFGQYLPERGFCEVTNAAGQHIHDIAPAEGGFLMIGEWSNQSADLVAVSVQVEWSPR